MWSLMRARCYLVWTRDAATRLRPDLHLITVPASDWSVQLPAVLWLADTVPSYPWQPGSDLWIWSALSRLIRAYLSTLCPHCYHTLSLSPVPAASLIGAQETEGLSLAFCHNSHFLAKQMSKVYCENKGSSLSIIYTQTSVLELAAWKQTLLHSSLERSRLCHCYSVVGDSFARMTPTSCPH